MNIIKFFDKLEDKEIWDLAFYVMSIPYSEEKIRSGENLEQFKLAEIALLSNEEMKEKFSIKDDNVIMSLRTADHQSSFDEYLNIAHHMLDESLQYYVRGEKAKAKQYAIQAYLQGIEPIEPAIRANNSELIVSIETAMSEIRKLIEIDKELPEQQIDVVEAEEELKISQATAEETEEVAVAAEEEEEEPAVSKPKKEEEKDNQKADTKEGGLPEWAAVHDGTALKSAKLKSPKKINKDTQTNLFEEKEKPSEANYGGGKL